MESKSVCLSYPVSSAKNQWNEPQQSLPRESSICLVMYSSTASLIFFSIFILFHPLNFSFLVNPWNINVGMTPLTNTKVVDTSADTSFIDLNANMANNDTDKNVNVRAISRSMTQISALKGSIFFWKSDFPLPQTNQKSSFGIVWSWPLSNSGSSLMFSFQCSAIITLTSLYLVCKLE